MMTIELKSNIDVKNYNNIDSPNYITTHNDNNTWYKSPGHSFCILDWTCCFRTPLCHVKFYIRIFCREVPGFATDCPCGVWYRGLTTCLLYVGPLFGNLIWYDSGFVSLTQWRTTFSLYLIMFDIYLNASQNDAILFSFTLFYVSNSALFFI